MASWMIHLRVADLLLDRIPDLDETAFVMGNIAPDSGTVSPDWSRYFPPKSVSHFKLESGEYDLPRFLGEYLTPELIRSYSRRAYSFFLGYYVHLLTDVKWAEKVYAPSRDKHLEATFRGDRTALIWALKKDWYDLDFRYLEEHPDFRAFRIYEEAVGFPNDLMDIFAPDAFEDRRHYVCSYYRGEHGELYRDYPWLTPAEADSFVAETSASIEPVLAPVFALRAGA